MNSPQELILGEFSRTLDERYRCSLPPELVDALGAVPIGGAQSGAVQSRDSQADRHEALEAGLECILAKERPGCLSLWNAARWRARLDDGVAIVQGKMQAGKLEGKWEDVQLFGRLLSTRHKIVRLAGRGRLSIPEGFREFLEVEAGGTAMVVGAGVCVEIWSPTAWLAFLNQRMPEFRQLFDQLSG